MAATASTKKVIVIGSGIAGTTSAFRLRQAGFEVTLLEQESYVGGRMSTHVTTEESVQYRIDRGASWLRAEAKSTTSGLTC